MDIPNVQSIAELLSFGCWNDQGKNFQLIVGSNQIQIYNQEEILIFLISLSLKIEMIKREGVFIEIRINDTIYKSNHNNIVNLKEVLSSRVTYLGVYNNYQILKQLGRGGQSDGVYEVLTIDSQEIKAMKQYKKLQQSIEKIHKEIKITQKFLGKNVIKINEVYESENSVFIIFERLKVFDPKDYNQKQKIKFIHDLLNTMQGMHSQQYLHRDIKLSNVMVNFQNEIKLIDFGLATRCKKQHKQCGTPGHMAPEIFYTNRYNQKCDVYSLGILIFEMLSEKQLFLGISKKDIKYKNQMGIYDNTKLSLLPQEFQELLKEMLQMNPTSRISVQKAKLSPSFANELNDSFMTDTTWMDQSEGQKHIQ
ncbi:hypothetical protein pb186bvf_020102 [Paramecium bursaria]